MTITLSYSDTAPLSSVMILHITVTTVSLLDKLKSELMYGCQSESLYEWRFTANQFILAPSPFETHGQNFFFSIEHLRT
jgi:hypothetical protein